MKNVNLTVAMLTALLVGQANAGDIAVFAGINAAEDSTYGNIGVVKAMNGDLSKSGMLLRGMLSYGQYDYDTTAVAGGNVEGDSVGAEVGVGYQWANPGNRVSLYAGLDYQDHDLSPNDVTNTVNGDESGAMIQAEIETLGSPWYGGLIAKYSSAYETYWVRGRLGHAFGDKMVGPEIVLGGNEEYDETRYGLFLNMPVSNDLSLSVSAGYREAEGNGARDDQDGGYINLSITKVF